MSLHEFIFSDKRSTRLTRHILFWLAWWIYFSATYYYYVQVGQQKISFGEMSMMLLGKTGILLIVQIISCYAFIYFLLPRYLLKAKYIEFAAGTILLMALLLLSGYFIHSSVFPYLDLAYHDNLASSNNTIWWASINSGLLTAPKIIAAAAGIVLIKTWYLKQKEKERVEKEKLVTDLQLLKAQMRPDFFFSALDHIHGHAQKKSHEAQHLLLKFSDLLSYLLYECDEPKVKLEKELAMMMEYMYLERLRFGKNLDMEIQVRGEAGDKRIEPLLLMPFIEHSFSQCSQSNEQPWINVGININGDDLTMKLMYGLPNSGDSAAAMPLEIANVQKRLQMLYPQSHELKMYAEQEIYMVLLKIRLNDRLVFETEPIHQFQPGALYAFN